MKGHRPITPKKLRWLTACQKCGLVYLKNEATRRAVRASCPGDHEDSKDSDAS